VGVPLDGPGTLRRTRANLRGAAKQPDAGMRCGFAIAATATVDLPSCGSDSSESSDPVLFG
jgi:hypothetical protein